MCRGPRIRTWQSISDEALTVVLRRQDGGFGSLCYEPSIEARAPDASTALTSTMAAGGRLSFREPV